MTTVREDASLPGGAASRRMETRGLETRTKAVEEALAPLIAQVSSATAAFVATYHDLGLALLHLLRVFGVPTYVHAYVGAVATAAPPLSTCNPQLCAYCYST